MFAYTYIFVEMIFVLGSVSHFSQRLMPNKRISKSQSRNA